jgi:1,4-dihydroxy-2-naphthoate octaprenyltransferase
MYYSNDKKWLREHIKASLFSTLALYLSFRSLSIFNEYISVEILELGLIEVGIISVGISALYNYYVNSYDYTPLKSVRIGVVMVVLNGFYLLFLVLFYGEKLLREDLPKKIRSQIR